MQSFCLSVLYPFCCLNFCGGGVRSPGVFGVLVAPSVKAYPHPHTVWDLMLCPGAIALTLPGGCLFASNTKNVITKELQVVKGLVAYGLGAN